MMQQRPGAVEWRSWLPAVWVATALAAVSAPAVRADELAAPSAPAALRGEFKIGREGRPILLPITIGDRTIKCLLDTGASSSGIDEDLRGALGEAVGSRLLQTPAGRKRTDTFEWPKVMIGGQVIRSDRPVVCLQLEHVRRAVNEEILAVLGMDVLRACRFQIDFEQGIIRFLELLPDDRTELGARIPIEFTEDGSPFVAASIDGDIDENFLIDTGAQGNSLGSDLFDQLEAQSRIRLGKLSVSATVAGQSRTKRGRVSSMSVGPFTHEWLRFSRVTVSSLGLRYLSRYSVTFDFPESALYLRKSNQFTKPDPQATSGMTLNWIDGKVTVESVERGGPGARAGIEPKDVLLRINQKDATEFDYLALRQLLTSRGGRKVPMRIRRSNQELDVVVVLADD